MNRFKETNAANDVRNNVIAHVVDPAIPSGGPVKPNGRRIVITALMLGALLGILVALLLERLDNTLKSAEDVENKLSQPMLAMLPLLTGKRAKAVGRHYLDEPQSVFSEAIRTARTSVLLSAIDIPHKVLLITSSIPSEGKTTFAINLALAHAQTKKVLLINADMRRPSLAEQLHLDSAKPGLSSVVSGTANLADCIQTVEGSHLHIISSGPIPPNPLELILSHRFKEMLMVCSRAYDIVVLDSPPVQLVSDAVVLGTMATGVLFVVKADSTPYQVARRCIRTLAGAGATVFGVALNQLEFKKADYYYGAYTNYSRYKYGAYPGKPAKPAKAA
jgi:capsular exopolysaccharide synthesis family protein